MSFLAGWRLVFLLAPIALLIAYLAAQRARQRYALRFTSVDLLASVAPRRPGWQRHVAAGVLLAALVVLVIGFARPAVDRQVPRDRATVMLVIDTSASMSSQDVAPSRLQAAQTQAAAFVRELPKGMQVGLVSFADTAQVLVSPTPQHATVLAAISALQLGQGTDTSDGIAAALNAIAAVPPDATGKAAPGIVVLMSDGTPTLPLTVADPQYAADQQAQLARQRGIPIETISFGTNHGSVVIRGRRIPVPADPGAMAQIASDSGGQTFTAETSDQLHQVYQQIGKAVGYETVPREITALFTGVALALCIVAAGAALWWTQRML